uniref:Transposase n=1 Tax=Heterorhabditis bacteriophora TaxID=37862 RepID=A0A1I7X4Q7_HETBA
MVWGAFSRMGLRFPDEDVINRNGSCTDY